MKSADSERAIIRVGEGRGFIVDGEFDPLVLTAAHCLPSLPQAGACQYSEERTFENLLGRLDDQELRIWAECKFVDPIADIAILGAPDDQMLVTQYKAYAKFMNDAAMIPITKVPFFDEPEDGTARLFNLTGQWSTCEVEIHGQAVNILNAPEGIFPGMSGSPILGQDWSAISLITNAGGAANEFNTDSGPNPCLTHTLPGWFFR